MTFILIYILIMMLVKPNIVSKEVIEATTIWYYNLLPTMYPSFVIIDLMINSKLSSKLEKLLFPIFRTIFNINFPKSSLIILFALISGAPTSTKIIKSALDNKQIDKTEADNLINIFSTLSLPFTLFIFKKNYLNPLTYYLLLIFISIILMKLFNKRKKINLDFKTDLNQDLLKNFFNSIQKNISIILNILGIIIFFKVIINFFLPPNFFLYSYIEILGGINKNSNALLIYTSLGFLGLSIHLQIACIYEKLNYYKFLLLRIPYLFLGLCCFL